MKITIPTHMLLDLTAEEFERESFERYMKWCELMAADYNKAKNKKFNTKDVVYIKVNHLLANTALANYYRFQQAELLHSFNVAGNKVYKLVSPNIIRNLFCEVMAELATNYPSALIEAAASLKIENQISLN